MTFCLNIVNNFGGFNMGDLENARARKEGSAFVYDNPEENCRLELKPSTDTVDVTQTGTCLFGFNVIANGTYKKGAVSEPPPSPLADGTYSFLDVSDSREATIKVRNVTGTPAASSWASSRTGTRPFRRTGASTIPKARTAR